MADYFTSDHFKLLNRWKGQKRDASNPEQNRAYEDLKKAYEVTEAWAGKVKDALFPVGHVEIRKRPTNQGNNFASYNWAKIYPSSEAPKELARKLGQGQAPIADYTGGLGTERVHGHPNSLTASLTDTARSPFASRTSTQNAAAANPTHALAG